jgi:hypothetical protein
MGVTVVSIIINNTFILTLCCPPSVYDLYALESASVLTTASLRSTCIVHISDCICVCAPTRNNDSQDVLPCDKLDLHAVAVDCLGYGS